MPFSRSEFMPCPFCGTASALFSHPLRMHVSLRANWGHQNNITEGTPVTLPLSSAFHLYSPIPSLSRATQTGTSTSQLNFHWREGTQKPHWDWFTLRTQPSSKDSGFIVLYFDIRTFLPATERIQGFYSDYHWSSGCFLPRPRKHIAEKEIKEQNQAPPLLLFSRSTLKPTF